MTERGNQAGPVIALVTSLEDPDKLGRVKVKYPWLDEKIESGWARIAAPFAGKDRGIQFIPEVGDEVLVFFQMGNFQKPVIVGSLWNGKDTPPSDVQEGKNHLKVIRTTASHKIEFSDNKDDLYILISDGEGKNSIKLNIKDGAIEIISEKKITIKSENGEIEMKADTIVFESKSKTEIKNGSSRMEINGSSVKINATAINLN
ncbi:MAG: phage baseplate assembly protein V [Bdellovibrionales bacterium]